MPSSIKYLLLLVLYNASWLVHAKRHRIKMTSGNEEKLIRRTEHENRLLQSSSMCSCSPTVFNIHINFQSDPCRTDALEDNSGIKGTLCLVGQTEGGSDNTTGVVMSQAPSPSTSGSNTSPVTIDAGGGSTYSPVATDAGSTSSPVATDADTSNMPSSNTDASKLPTFSPTFNPTSETSTAGSTSVTQDPFLPPAGAMPIPPPEDAVPTYNPTTPFPTYGTYSPTYSTYAPTAGAVGTKKKDVIEPVKAASPSFSTTYYPTVDDTYAPTEKRGHDAASLIQRVKKMNTPSTAYTYAPSTPFPTFDTYSPTQFDVSTNRELEEPKRRLLEVINLDQVMQNPSALSSIVEAWRSIPPNDEFFSRFPEWRERQEDIYRLKHDETAPELSHSNQQSRMLQASIAVPTQLISAQFLEIDTSPDMTIINQDDSYLNLTDFHEGTLSYTSISATLDPSVSLEDQLDSVPGGAILVLIGQDESGELVRNRLMWTYTMKCGMEVETVRNGNEFGWALFDDLEPAREEFCPASSATPSPSPPSTGFSMDYDTMDYNRLLSHFDLEGSGSSSQGRPGRRQKGRRGRKNNDVGKKLDVSETGNAHQYNPKGETPEEFGRALSKTVPEISNIAIDEEPQELEFGRQMTRLRKRITV